MNALPRAVPALRIGLVVTGTAALAAVCLGLSFRLPFALGAGSLDPAIAANAARLALAAVAGAGLAASEVLARLVQGDPLREVRLFAVATGAAAGVSLSLVVAGGFVPAGFVPAIAFGIAGAVLFGGAVHLCRGPRRGTNLALALLLPAMFVSAILAAAVGATEAAGLGGFSTWILGSVGGASFSGVVAAGIAILAGVAVAAWRVAAGTGVDAFAPGSAEGRGDLGVLSAVLLGLSVGAAGLVAFVGAAALGVVGIALGRGVGARAALLSSALVGAGLLMAADAIPRAVVGGYALPLDVSIGAFAVPGFLVWNRRRLRVQSEEAGEPARRVFGWAEGVAIAVGAALLLGFAYAYSAVVRALT